MSYETNGNGLGAFRQRLRQDLEALFGPAPAPSPAAEENAAPGPAAAAGRALVPLNGSAGESSLRAVRNHWRSDLTTLFGAEEDKTETPPDTSCGA